MPNNKKIMKTLNGYEIYDEKARINKVDLPIDSYGNVNHGNDGQVLISKGNGKTEWKDNSDATVTTDSITKALGYKPANAETVSALQEQIADQQTEINNKQPKGDYALKSEVEALPNNETLIENVAEVVKAEVPLVKSAEQPDFANDVSECTDTSKVYVLPDGYLYGYCKIENYNLFKMSEVSYSSRLQDDVSGIIASNTQNAVTGWIPVEYGKYYAPSVLTDGNRVSDKMTFSRMNLKRADGTIVVYNKNTVPHVSSVAYSWHVIDLEYEDVVAIQLHFSIVDANSQQLDISTATKLEAFKAMFVEGDTPTEAHENALNSPYIDGDAESITEWYNTGLAYNQPVDYEGRILELESDTNDIKTDMEELKANMENPSSASPYYRNVNYGVIPFNYYQGLADDYESQSFVKTTLYADYIAKWKALVTNHSGYVTETELGSASDGQKIYLYDFKPTRIANQYNPIPKIIIIAGQHGFEKSNIFGLYYFVDNLLNKWDKHPSLEYLRNNVELMIVPVLNTYGFDSLEYKNANGVNTNRNYDSNWSLVEDVTSSNYGGAEPFDQPETQIVRDLLSNNTDALLVIDFHTNGAVSVTNYADVNWCGLCSCKDDFYIRMRDMVSHHLSAITSHFNLDYELNHPNVMMGHMTTSDGTGLLRGWATDNNIIGVLIEGFNGFPNKTEYTSEVYKANEEIIVSYLINAINYLSK